MTAPMNKILDTIEKLKAEERSKGVDPTAKYLHGFCGNVFTAIHAEHPEVTPWHMRFGRGHILTKDNGTFYDITGAVDPWEIIGNEWEGLVVPATAEDIARCSDNQDIFDEYMAKQKPQSRHPKSRLKTFLQHIKTKSAGKL